MNQKKAGVLLSYGQTILSTLISLTYTPVMLRLLGQSEYGLYTLVNGFVSNLSLLSFGMGSAYMRYYSRAEAQDGEDGVARINGMFMTIFFAISLLCLLTGGVLVANVKNIFAAKLTAKELDTAKILMALLVVNIAASFPASVFFSYITAKERFLFQRLVGMLRTVLNPIVMLPLLLMGYGSIALVLVTLILTAISDAVSIWYCVKKLRMRITFGKFDFGLLRDMAGFSFFIFLNEIINQINWTVDTTLLGIISGTAATAIYGVGAQINQYYMALSTSISGVFTPQINRIVARGEGDEQLTRLFTRVGRIQFMLLMLVLKNGKELSWGYIVSVPWWVYLGSICGLLAQLLQIVGTLRSNTLVSSILMLAGNLGMSLTLDYVFYGTFSLLRAAGIFLILAGMALVEKEKTAEAQTAAEEK